MPLQKKTLSFALVKGIDEKSSSPSRPPDGLVKADNVVFTKTGQVRKRGGFILTNSTVSKIGGGTISTGKAIAKYGDETLILDGSNLYSKIPESTGILDRGTYVPCTIENKIKHRKLDRRQGNAQIAENNGIRVYVWEEYEFEGTKYNTYVDIEHIATGASLISTTQMSSETITVDTVASGAPTALYKIGQPQCGVIGNYIFILYQEAGNMRYRYVLTTSASNAAAVSAEQNLYKTGTTTQVTLDTDYPVFQIDKFTGATHSDAFVFAAYTGSNNVKVQYLTASGATLSMPAPVQTIGNAHFHPYAKGTGGMVSGLMLKCLNDETDGNSYTIIVGFTVSDSGYKLGLHQVKDNLTATVTNTYQNALPAGGTGDLYLLNGTAGVVADEDSVIRVFVGAWASGSNLGTQKTIVPEHFVRYYLLTRGSTSIAKVSDYFFNASITSDFFRFNSQLYCVVSQVNDNGLYEDSEATDIGASRGLNNNSVLVNLEGELIGALQTGSGASCLTSEYLTMNPADVDSGGVGRENRRLIHGVQRVTSRNSATAFVFGASLFFKYAFHDAGTYAQSDSPDNVFGVSLMEVDFAPARTLAYVDVENTWAGTGGFLHGYDGNQVFENNFVAYPAIQALQQSGATTASYVSGSVAGFPNAKTYKYLSLYAWTDDSGNLHRSKPSQFIEITTGTGRVKTGTVTAVGSGYSAGTFATTVSPSGGTECTVTITVSAGGISGFTIIDQGSGYSPTDVLTVATGSGGTIRVDTTYETVYTVIDTYIPSFSRKSGVMVEIYRNHEGEDIFYLAGSKLLDDTPTASTIRFIDYPEDYAKITTHEPLYTTGGFPASEFVGSCTDLVRHQNKLFAAGMDDTVYISAPVIEGVGPIFPVTEGPFTLNLPGDPSKITAIESNFDHLLIFTADNGFFVSGSGPNLLGEGAFRSPRLFASDQGAKLGAAHTNSPLGVFYQADRGIYLIGRDMSVGYAGANVEDIVGANTAVSMVRHDDDNTIRIMLQAASPGSSGTDVYCVYNYYFKQWSTFGVAYTSSAYQKGEIYDGSTFQRLTADAKQWEQSTTVFQDNSANYNMTIQTGFISPTGLMKKDRTYRVMFLGQYVGAHDLDLVLYHDYSTSATQTVEKTLSGAPTGAYLYRTHVEKQKSRAIQLKLVLTGSTACAHIEGLALEVGLRPEATTFKTIADRTI